MIEMKNKELYSFLKENKEDVIMCDRTGNIISVYLKRDIKVVFTFHTVSVAKRNYTLFRKELQGMKV